MGRYDLQKQAGPSPPDGDRGFNGCHSKLPREQLAPGYCARLENKRLTHGAVTRPGTRTPLFANLFSVPTGRLLGSGTYSNPNGSEYGLLAFTTGVVAIKSGTVPIKIPVQNSFGSPVEFSQHFDKVFAHEADPTARTQVWDGLDFTTGFIEIADPPVGSDPGILVIPNPAYSINYQNRAWFPIPDKPDQIGASDALNPGIYDSVLHSFRVNLGTADAITGIYPFFNNSIIIGKERSIDFLSNIPPDLGDSFLLAVEFGISPASAPPPRATYVSNQIGISARKSWIINGGRGLFYSNYGGGGIYAVVPDQSRTNYSVKEFMVDPTPVSDPIEPIMKRINPSAAAGIIGGSNGIYAFWAVPLDDATFNNAMIVLDTTSNQWVSAPDAWYDEDWDLSLGVTQGDDSPLRMDNMFPMNFYGSNDIFTVDNTHAAVRRMYHGLDDQLQMAGSTGNVEHQTYPIQDVIETRGYWTGSAMDTECAKIGFGTLEPSITITQLNDGDDTSEGEIGNNPITRSRTGCEQSTKVPFKLNNTNDDFDAPRDDYAVHLNDGIHLQDGVRIKRITPWQHELSLSDSSNFTSFRIENKQGVAEVRNVQFEESSTRTERTAA